MQKLYAPHTSHQVTGHSNITVQRCTEDIRHDFNVCVCGYAGHPRCLTFVETAVLI